MNQIKKKGFFKFDNIGILFVLPAFIYMLIFVGYPIVRNIVLSLQDVTVRTLTADSKPFVGFKNYMKIFQDPVFTKSMLNTLIFTLCCLAVQFVIGFLLALFFNQHFSVAKPVRGLLLIPWMIPITVTALMFKFIFGTDVGILNYFLKSIGIISQNIDWLTSANTALFAIVCANVWIGIPFNMILISTGLTTIPKELYESASIDGAGKWTQFFKITVPLITPVIFYNLITQLCQAFQEFNGPFLVTKGGPNGATTLISILIYNNAFLRHKMGMASAQAWVLFVIVCVLTAVAFVSQKKWVYYN